MEEATRIDHLGDGRESVEAKGAAAYQRAEVHRLRGELDAAEEAYRQASQLGAEPQPGLALLRLAQGEAEAAAQAIRRALASTGDPLARTRYLPAMVEIALGGGALDDARAAAAELEEIAGRFETDVLAAIAAHARGAVCLADGNPEGALEPLRRAFVTWRDLGARFIAARIRVLVGRACEALGDQDGASLERDAAREIFEQLGAAPDLRRLAEPAPTGPAGPPREESARPSAPAAARGLTVRELEVLRLVASGKTNKEIAADLSLSAKTIDRHLSNIFAKLEVTTRAAATAFAYQNGLA
jgi:ATP/maltotriose-dependent transcriptional regulator MalT